MKKIACLILALSAFNFVSAQSLNNNGLYVDSEGALFSGTITKTQNNIKSEYNVSNGEINGPASYSYTSGKLMETGTYTKGLKDQKWVRYNENGTLSAIAFYSLGKKTGTWMVYDEKGKTRLEMNYTDGAKTGIWTSWDETGAVTSTKDYSKLN